MEALLARRTHLKNSLKGERNLVVVRAIDAEIFAIDEKIRMIRLGLVKAA